MVAPAKVVARFCSREGAKRKPTPDLYRNLQGYFKQFQASLFALTPQMDSLPESSERDALLELISDTPELLDDTIGVKDAEIEPKAFGPKLDQVAKNLDELETRIRKAVTAVPVATPLGTKMQKATLQLVQSRLKAARAALKYIREDMEWFVESNAKDEAKRKKDKEKADKKDALCQKMCPSCSAPNDEVPF